MAPTDLFPESLTSPTDGTLCAINIVQLVLRSCQSSGEPSRGEGGGV